MFEFDKVAIKTEELDLTKTEYLIDSFLVKEAITMIYGAASQGKTWFMYALAEKLLNQGIKRLYYVDMDNPKRQLIARGVDKNLLIYENIKYITKSSLKFSIDELLMSIKKEAYGRNFEDIVFIFDSTRDFVDVKNDRAAKGFMETMKQIREAGATVLLIHHATKSGRYIEGSAEFTRAADNVYELKQKLRSGTKIHYSLKVENDRDPIKDKSFIVDTSSFLLSEDDDTFAKLSQEDEEFVKAVLNAIHNGLNTQGEILMSLGKKKDDKTARKKLESFIGQFWIKKQDGRKKLYLPK